MLCNVQYEKCKRKGEQKMTSPKKVMQEEALWSAA
jgi:hypothetical protein